MINTPNYPVLQDGYTSLRNIYALTCLLNYHNISVALSSSYNSAIKTAVTTFQRNKNLTADGIAGPDTLKALVGGVTVRNGDSNMAVRAAQSLLAKFESITITGSFTSATEAIAINFQKTMGIGTDGIIGSTTWCYLFGYYFYPRLGCDTATSITNARLKLLQDNGYTFVGRYLPGSAYALTTSERDIITGGGLYIVSIWESGSPTSDSYFSTSKGKSDAQNAINGAKSIGQPTGTPIYFTIDYNAQSAAINGVINDYLTAIDNVFKAQGSPYKLGLYGSGLVLNSFQHLFPYRMLAGATGWSGSSAYTEYCLKQFLPRTLSNSSTSIEIDDEYSNGAAGGWN